MILPEPSLHQLSIFYLSFFKNNGLEIILD